MECTGPELQDHLDLSHNTIARLEKEGVVVRIKRGVYDLDQSRLRYIRHLRDTAAGRGGSSAVESLSEERARLAKEQADHVALKNAQMRGDLVAKEDVISTWSGILSDVRAGLLAVPSRVQQRISNLTSHDIEAIDSEIRDALRTLGEDGSNDPA